MSAVVAIPLWPTYINVKIDPLPGINLTRVIIFVLMSLYLFNVVAHARFQNYAVKTLSQNIWPVFAVMTPFYLWNLLTITQSPRMSYAIFAAGKDVIFCFVLFVIAITVWRDPRQLYRIILLLVVSSIIILAIGMIEAIMENNVFQWLMPEDYVSGNKAFESIKRDGIYRIKGTFTHPLALASYSTMILPVAYWLWRHGYGRHRWLGFVAAVGMIFVSWMTGSRAALLVITLMTYGLVSALFLRWAGRVKGFLKPLILPVALAAILASSYLVLGVGQSLGQGKTEMETGSTTIRLFQLNKGIPLVLSKPLMGFGPGESAMVLDVGQKSKTIDNYYLTLLLESGIPSLLLFLFILLYFLRLAWKLMAERGMPLPGLAGAMFFAIAGNVAFMAILSLEQTMPLMFLFFAALIALRRTSGKERVLLARESI